MPIILSIETSTPVCSVAIHEGDELIAFQQYHQSKSHSSLLPLIIKQAIENIGLKIKDLDVVAVSAGPGSYTGLRIGVSTAKGIAYANNIPLIGIGSLDAMFEEVKPFLKEGDVGCPMMDARRMEVYMQLQSVDGSYIKRPSAVVVDQNIFADFNGETIFVFGDGAHKTLSVIQYDNLDFIAGVVPTAKCVGALAFHKFQESDFVDVAYFEPDYLKEYRTIPAKPKLPR